MQRSSRDTWRGHELLGNGRSHRKSEVTSAAVTSDFLSAVGLVLEGEIGAGYPTPGPRRANVLFDLNEMAVTGGVDRGVGGLDSEGGFAGVPWCTARATGVEFPSLRNPDATFTRRRYFRDAAVRALEHLLHDTPREWFQSGALKTAGPAAVVQCAP